jgi:hypothetical protein
VDDAKMFYGLVSQAFELLPFDKMLSKKFGLPLTNPDDFDAWKVEPPPPAVRQVIYTWLIESVQNLIAAERREHPDLKTLGQIAFETELAERYAWDPEEQKGAIVQFPWHLLKQSDQERWEKVALAVAAALWCETAATAHNAKVRGH